MPFPVSKEADKDLNKRSEFLLRVMGKYASFGDTILEIGCGDGRNLRYLRQAGWKSVNGIDKSKGTAIEDLPLENLYDIVFTMSCLFLIPPENRWVFGKIAMMTRKHLIIIEGEKKNASNAYFHPYQKIFEELGMKQIYHQSGIFNSYGHLRVFANKIKIWL